MVMEESKVSRLIDEVKKRPELWDKTLKEFQNKTRKGLEWNKVAANLNVSKSAAQSKWKSLVTTFKAEHSLVQSLRSGDGLEDVYKPSWTYYSSLLFLTKSSVANESTGNISQAKTHANSMLEKPCTADSVSSKLSAVPALPMKMESSLNSNTSSDLVSAILSNNQNEVAAQILKMESTKLALLEKSFATNSEKCDTKEWEKLHMCYFETLLPSLRKVSVQDIMICQNDISRVVHRYAFKGVAWKSLSAQNEPAVQEKKREIKKRKVVEDDECQIVNYFPAPPSAKSDSSIRVKWEQKYEPSLREREMERQNMQISENEMPWYGNHSSDQTYIPLQNWNEQQYHELTPTQYNEQQNRQRMGSNWHSPVGISRQSPAATITRPLSNVRSETPSRMLTGGDRRQRNFREMENYDWQSRAPIPPQSPAATFTRPPTNAYSENAGRIQTADAREQRTYIQNQDWRSQDAITPQYPSATTTHPLSNVDSANAGIIQTADAREQHTAQYVQNQDWRTQDTNPRQYPSATITRPASNGNPTNQQRNQFRQNSEQVSISPTNSREITTQSIASSSSSQAPAGANVKVVSSARLFSQSQRESQHNKENEPENTEDFSEETDFETQ